MNISIRREREFTVRQYQGPAPVINNRSDADEIAELWATIQWLTERLDALDGGGEDKHKKKRNGH